MSHGLCLYREGSIVKVPFPTYPGVDVGHLDQFQADTVVGTMHELVSSIKDHRSCLPQASLYLCRALLIATGDRFEYDGVRYRFGVLDFDDGLRPQYVVLIPEALQRCMRHGFTPLASIDKSVLPPYLLDRVNDPGARLRYFKVG